MGPARLRDIRPGVLPGPDQGEPKMRVLSQHELVHVAGAGGNSCYNSCPTPPRCPPSSPSKSKSKGNNGYGNGGHDGSPNGKQDRTR